MKQMINLFSVLAIMLLLFTGCEETLAPETTEPDSTEIQDTTSIDTVEYTQEQLDSIEQHVFDSTWQAMEEWNEHNNVMQLFVFGDTVYINGSQTVITSTVANITENDSLGFTHLQLLNVHEDAEVLTLIPDNNVLPPWDSIYRPNNQMTFDYLVSNCVDCTIDSSYTYSPEPIYIHNLNTAFGITLPDSIQILSPNPSAHSNINIETSSQYINKLTVYFMDGKINIYGYYEPIQIDL
jgi:hypothetical protein